MNFLIFTQIDKIRKAQNTLGDISMPARLREFIQVGT